MGFGCFLTLPMVLVDKALLMAFMERWSPITLAFHLLVGEIRLPPIDLFTMMGLSMGGTPPPSSEDFDLALVACCIGPQPMLYYKGTRGVLPSQFEEYVWAIDASSEVEQAQSTRAFLPYMLTLSIFCGKSDRVYFHLLPTLEDLALVASRSWVRSALGWMYLNMTEISMGQSPAAFVGLCFLWEVMYIFFISFVL